MQEHGVPPSDASESRPCYGWLAAAPEDEGFIGSYGRAFDITVIRRVDSETRRLARPPHRTGAPPRVRDAAVAEGRPGHGADGCRRPGRAGPVRRRRAQTAAAQRD